MTHVFISYLHEDDKAVARLVDALRSGGISVWLDREQIMPGQRWKAAIRHAIQDGAYFLACFSKSLSARSRSYLHEELTLAIEELRQRPIDRTWFIPLLLEPCSVPRRSIGGGETLHDIQWIDASQDWERAMDLLISVLSQGSPTNSELHSAEMLATRPLPEVNFLEMVERVTTMFELVGSNGREEQGDSDSHNAENDTAWSVGICSVDGQRFEAGLSRLPFLCEDIGFLFVYARALESFGARRVHEFTGFQPNGSSRNQIPHQMQPKNPFTVAGGLMSCALLRSGGEDERLEKTLDLWKGMTGATRIHVDSEQASLWKDTACQEQAIAHLLLSQGRFPEGIETSGSIDNLLRMYWAVRSIETDTSSLAIAAATLANMGKCPVGTSSPLAKESVKLCLNLMGVAGFGEYSGRFQLFVGMPAFGAANGCIMVAVPNRFGVCVYSPRLNDSGMSAKGVSFLEKFFGVVDDAIISFGR